MVVQGHETLSHVGGPGGSPCGIACVRNLWRGAGAERLNQLVVPRAMDERDQNTRWLCKDLPLLPLSLTIMAGLQGSRRIPWSF